MAHFPALVICPDGTVEADVRETVERVLSEFGPGAAAEDGQFDSCAIHDRDIGSVRALAEEFTGCVEENLDTVVIVTPGGEWVTDGLANWLSTEWVRRVGALWPAIRTECADNLAAIVDCHC